MIVADTNLVVYAALAGERTTAAERVRSLDAEWVAPPLWRSEFRNALVQNVRHGRLTDGQAGAVWEVTGDLVRDVPVDPLGALGAAFTFGLSGYDAEFVALADALGVPLVTDDRGVLRACPKTAVSIDDFLASGPDLSGQ